MMLFYALLAGFSIALHWSEAKESRRPANDVIFQCFTQAEDYAGRFSLTETGRFFLKATKGKEEFDCDLRLIEFSNRPKDEVPNLTFRMTPTACKKPDGVAYTDRTLVKNMSLIVTPYAANKFAADVQWITYLQPSDCKIEKRNPESLIRNAEKFRKGIF